MLQSFHIHPRRPSKKFYQPWSDGRGGWTGVWLQSVGTHQVPEKVPDSSGTFLRWERASCVLWGWISAHVWIVITYWRWWWFRGITLSLFHNRLNPGIVVFSLLQTGMLQKATPNSPRLERTHWVVQNQRLETLSWNIMFCLSLRVNGFVDIVI